MKKKLFPILFIFSLSGLLPLTSSSQSVVTIEGGASITITGGGSGDAYFCPDSFYVVTGGSLTAWSPEAICNALIGGDGTVSQGFIKANIKIFLEGAYK